MATTTKTPVMISGPGKAGKIIGKTIKDSGEFELLPFALTKTSTGIIDIDGVKIQSIPLSERAKFDMKSLLPSNALVIDFTLPNAVLENVKYYVANGMNFMMGTTGVDKVRSEVETLINGSGITALIAANMAAGIVGLQSIITNFAKLHPGGLAGCTIRVEESHQGPDPQRPEFKAKADPSGTAIAISKSLAALEVGGCPFSSEAIMKNPEMYAATTFYMIRNRSYQREVLGVPAEYLDGHGWHTYIITDHVMSPAFGAFYHTLNDFMKSSPIFNQYSRMVRDKPKDHTEGCLAERRSPDGNVLFSVELRYDPASYGKTPVMQTVFKHNVNGRSVYGDGTVMGLLRLRELTGQGKILSMADALGLA